MSNAKLQGIGAFVSAAPLVNLGQSFGNFAGVYSWSEDVHVVWTLSSHLLVIYFSTYQTKSLFGISDAMSE